MQPTSPLVLHRVGAILLGAGAGATLWLRWFPPADGPRCPSSQWVVAQIWGRTRLQLPKVMSCRQGWGGSEGPGFSICVGKEVLESQNRDDVWPRPAGVVAAGARAAGVGALLTIQGFSSLLTPDHVAIV